MQYLFTDYKDIFSEKKAVKFSDIKMQYKIHLEEGATALYESFYNLSIKKLNILHKYFKEAQLKN